jgi:hypothetical protein
VPLVNRFTPLIELTSSTANCGGAVKQAIPSHLFVFSHPLIKIRDKIIKVKSFFIMVI